MNKQLSAGVILSYVIYIVQAVIQIIYTPIILQILGQNEYGVYTLVGSVMSYLSLCGLGFSGSYFRFYSQCQKQKRKEAELNGMFLVLYIIAGFVSVILGTILFLNAEMVLGNKITISEIEIAKVLMAILVINIAVSLVNTIFDSIISAHEAYIFQRIVRLCSVIANPLIALPLLLMGHKSVALVLVTTALSLATFVVNIFYCRKVLMIPFNFGHFDVNLLKEITVFSFFIFLNMIIDQLNWNVDKLLLGRFSGTAAVAVYGIGSQLNMIVINISLAVSSVFAPRINRMEARKAECSEFTELFIKTGRIQFIIMTLLDSTLLFLGKDFICLWVGTEYIEAYYVMLLLTLPAIVPCIQNIGLEIQRAKNKHQFRTVVYLTMAIINVCISIPLAQKYDAIGVTLGTTISFIIGNGLIMNWFYDKKLGLDIKKFWGEIRNFVPSLAVPFVVGIFIWRNVCIDTWLQFVVICLLYVTVYVFFMWKFGLNKYEKQFVRTGFQEIIENIR